MIGSALSLKGEKETEEKKMNIVNKEGMIYPIILPLVFGRCHHAMHATLQPPTGDVRDGIRKVHCNGAWLC